MTLFFSYLAAALGVSLGVSSNVGGLGLQVGG